MPESTPAAAPVAPPAASASVSVPGIVGLDLTEFLRSLAERLEAQVRRDSRRHARLGVMALAFSLAGSLIAAAVAVFGPMLLDALRASGARNPSVAWQVPCFVVALLGAGSALVSGLQERFDTKGRVADARACLGKVRALQVGRRYRPEGELLQQLEELVGSHPELLDSRTAAELRLSGPVA